MVFLYNEKRWSSHWSHPSEYTLLLWQSDLSWVSSQRGSWRPLQLTIHCPRSGTRVWGVPQGLIDPHHNMDRLCNELREVPEEKKWKTQQMIQYHVVNLFIWFLLTLKDPHNGEMLIMNQHSHDSAVRLISFFSILRSRCCVKLLEYSVYVTHWPMENVAMILKNIIFKLIVLNRSFGACCEIVFRWIPLITTYEEST